MKAIKLSLLVAISALLFASCSTIKKHDDAVRIKNDKAAEYARISKSGENRIGSTLEGTVIQVQITSRPVSCEEDIGFFHDTTVVFLDNRMPAKKEYYERIPFGDIDHVKYLFDGPINEYENINLFENYNETTKFLGIREVPVTKRTINNCNPCGCYEWDYAIDFDIKCPEIKYSWYFLELRYGLAIFQDYRRAEDELQRSEVLFESAAGFRFGNNRQWGLGLIASTGVPVFDAIRSSDYQRPFVAFHGRWQSSKSHFLGICLKPFLYANFGLPIDNLSVALPRLSLSTDCKECKEYLEDLKAKGLLPGADFSLPLVYGFGAGFDLPFIGTDFMSLSADIGFRSVGIGEEMEGGGFYNVPTMRRVNMLLFRLGFTF